MSWDIDSLEYYVALLKKNNREQKAPYVVLGESSVRTVNKCHHFKGYVRLCAKNISEKHNGKEACVQGRSGALEVGLRLPVQLVTSEFGPYIFFTYLKKLEAIPL